MYNSYSIKQKSWISVRKLQFDSNTSWSFLFVNALMNHSNEDLSHFFYPVNVLMHTTSQKIKLVKVSLFPLGDLTSWIFTQVIRQILFFYFKLLNVWDLRIFAWIFKTSLNPAFTTPSKHLPVQSQHKKH